MNTWIWIFLILSWAFSFVSFLPLLPITHWSVRIFDFVRIQLLVVLIILFLTGIYVSSFETTWITATQIGLLAAIGYHVLVIFPYLSLFYSKRKTKEHDHDFTLISVNVYQENREYDRLIQLVKEYRPDILLTLETDTGWDKALEEVEKLYPTSEKIPFDNTYGMHFFTKLEVKNIRAHYFVSDERPAIEAHLTDPEGREFVFWGVHPPPPSPTEMPTSRQKDAELMIVGKLISKSTLPTVVAGDFNSVCWSKSSRLFSKIARLKDARFGKGVHATFPVRPKIFRFPIDLLFYSKGVVIDSLQTLRDIGSDHLPLFSNISITTAKPSNNKKVDSELKEDAETIIEEGNEALDEEPKS